MELRFNTSKGEEVKDIEEILSEYRELIPKYAKAKSYKEYLSDWRKAHISKLIVLAESKGIQTAAKQERDALSSEDYEKTIKGLEQAIHEEAELHYKIKALEFEIEIWRTEQANKRAERKAYNA